MNTLFINNIRSKLHQELPGLDAQKKMAPTNRIPPNYNPNPENAKQSAVLLLIFPYQTNELSIVFIHRANDGREHSGQIGFPGGEKEELDKDLIQTSLRETHEEIGIHPADVEVLGCLTRLFIDVSNFSVLPVVGYSEKKLSFNINHTEVHDILIVPLESLFDRKIISTSEFKTIHGNTEAPCFVFHDNIIWGATAMILNEFIEIIKKIN